MFGKKWTLKSYRYKWWESISMVFQVHPKNQKKEIQILKPYKHLKLKYYKISRSLAN